jgi:hypothetical protein
MCHGRLGSSHSVRDPTKRPAPVWRETYKKPDGAKRARWSAAGKLGNQPACRSSQGRCWRSDPNHETKIRLATAAGDWSGQITGWLFSVVRQRGTAIFLLSKRSMILASGTSIT